LLWGTSFWPNSLDLCKINKRVERQHERAGFPLAFAGVEILLDAYGPAKDLLVRQAEVYGIVVGLEIDAVKKAIHREYPSEARSQCHCR
jgi:hypothetical protein